jgi:hypothetical protein
MGERPSDAARGPPIQKEDGLALKRKGFALNYITFYELCEMKNRTAHKYPTLNLIRRRITE